MKDNMAKNWEITKEVIGRGKNDSQQAFREMYCQREKNYLQKRNSKQVQ